MCVKNVKRPQPPLQGLVRKDHFQELGDVKDPINKQIDSMETQNDVKKTMMCLLRMMNLARMILLISLKMFLKSMLNFANY